MLSFEKYVMIICNWERYQRISLNDGPILCRLRKVSRRWAACADEMQMQCGLLCTVYLGRDKAAAGPAATAAQLSDTC